jgi:hypothetical protein
MRKLAIAMIAVVLGSAAPAQEALQCANPDVLNALVFNGWPDSKLTIRRALPANAAGYRAPAGFTLIGSAVRGQGGGPLVAYKTTLETGKAFDSLLGLLANEGWRRETTAQAQPLVSVAGAPTSATVCRNGERRGLQVQDAGDVRYISISGFTTPGWACDAPNPPGFDPMAARNVAMTYMPRFSFPATARMAAGSALPPGNNLAFSSARIESPDTAASLARQLARQLAEQGWRADADWNGAVSTGSTWTRSGADQRYWGTLEITALGGNVYNIGFAIVGATR